MMLWGMGMILTPDEDKQLAEIVKPCYAALGLANDYFSFDREWSELTDSGGDKLTNAVWLLMQWHRIDVAEAKQAVRGETNKHEQRFQELRKEFVRTQKPEKKLIKYLEALSHQVSGNVVWSLNCPRYCPQYRYDPNAGVENLLTMSLRGKRVDDFETAIQAVCHQASRESRNRIQENQENHRHQSSSTSLDTMYGASGRSSTGASSSNSSITRASSAGAASGSSLSAPKQITAPFEYTVSLPSKGVRSTFIDALNVWCRLPPQALHDIKSIIDQLHTASLMLDDVEDGSDLRRGQPACHTKFGIPQTINSANLAIMQAMARAWELPRQTQSVHVILGKIPH